MGNFYTDVIQQDPRFHSIASVRDVALLEPQTRIAVQAIIDGAAQQGISLEVTETFRSEERQQHLFEQGATQLRTVGTHNYGIAADFCKIVDGVASWDRLDAGLEHPPLGEHPAADGGTEQRVAQHRGEDALT